MGWVDGSATGSAVGSAVRRERDSRSVVQRERRHPLVEDVRRSRPDGRACRVGPANSSGIEWGANQPTAGGSVGPAWAEGSVRWTVRRAGPGRPIRSCWGVRPARRGQASRRRRRPMPRTDPIGRHRPSATTNDGEVGGRGRYGGRFGGLERCARSGSARRSPATTRTGEPTTAGALSLNRSVRSSPAAGDEEAWVGEGEARRTS